MVVQGGHPSQSSGTTEIRTVVTVRHPGTDAVAQPPPMDRGDIGRVLVANRGEIARRVFATCRRLGISTAAVYSDADASAAFVGEADVAVALGGASPAESYLRADAILDAARRAGADAIHPGYGFLSENAAFAQAVIDAGLIWIGPSPDAIAAMGSKTEARDRMERAGVPVLPGARLDGEVDGALRAIADAIGFPLLVKASAGGGGKGMRLVDAPDDLAAALDGARREAASAFGDATVFLERFAPAVAARRDPDRRRPARQRLRAARARLLGPAAPSEGDRGGAVTGRHAGAARAHERRGGRGGRGARLRRRGDRRVPAHRDRRVLLPRGQHAPAGRASGHRARDRARPRRAAAARGRGPRAARGGAGAALDGHAVEARLYAEDPANGFLPAIGDLERFSVPAAVRVDSAIDGAARITPALRPDDRQGHRPRRRRAPRRSASSPTPCAAPRSTASRPTATSSSACSPTRSSARARPTRASSSATTRRSSPRRCCPRPSCAATPRPPPRSRPRRRARQEARVLGGLPSGWRNNPSVPQDAPTSARTWWSSTCCRARGELASLRVRGHELESPRLHGADRRRGRPRGRRRAPPLPRPAPAPTGAVFVNTDEGQLDLVEAPRFPEASHAAQPGSLAVAAPRPRGARDGRGRAPSSRPASRC